MLFNNSIHSREWAFAAEMNRDAIGCPYVPPAIIRPRSRLGAILKSVSDLDNGNSIKAVKFVSASGNREDALEHFDNFSGLTKMESDSLEKACS